MKKYVLVSLCSAATGAVLSAILTAPGNFRSVSAQEPRPGAAVLAERSIPPQRVAPPRQLVPGSADNSLTAEELVNVSVYENVNRSVVNIDTKTVRNDGFFLLELPTAGSGSGSVLDTQGHILTNNHVVDGARDIKVTLYDSKVYDARLVGKDETSDVAVLKIDAPASSLFPVVLGDSKNLKVGQRVFAIGNPFGLDRTLTTGIISSLNRELPVKKDLHRTMKAIIQTDAAINPGNSGGPLLDGHSRLIGMNTAIASSTGQSAGVGFAVPVGNIARVVPQLIERGKVIRADAGITRVLQTEQGLYIATMVPGGPAERAGLRGFRVIRQRKKQGPFSYESSTIDRNSADLITAVDGTKIVTPNDFLAAVEVKRPGDEVVLTVIREGRELNVNVRLAAGE